MSTEARLIGGGAYTWPTGVGRIVLDETDSTMAEARRLGPGLTGPTWILARRQTAGIGRRGRAWQHPAGNFAATIFLPRPGNPIAAAQRSFTAALALRAAILASAPKARLSLKWPNDVLLSGGKVAGILLEGAGQGERMDWLAIGVGVNLVAAPPVEALEEGASLPVSLFAETGIRVDPELFLTDLAHAFAREEESAARHGFGLVREEWLSHAARLGEPIVARMGRETLHGTFETVDESGNLVLRTPDGTRAIAAADVHFD